MSHTLIRWGGMASLILLLSGCAGLQKSTALLDVEEALAEARQDEQILRYAPAELERAKEAINRAARAETAEEMSSMAYVGKTRLLTAQSVAERKAANARVKELGKLKDQARLNAREFEIQLEQDAKNEAMRNEAAAMRDKESAMRDKEAALMAREQAVADAEALRSQLAELEAKKTERGMVMTLGDVLFSTGKTELLPGAMSTISKLASFLAEYPEKTILIEGHTDSVGSDAFNQDLSERRATSVKSALTEAGVEDARIDTQGLGETQPVADNDNSAGRLKNRRVEIVIRD